MSKMRVSNPETQEKGASRDFLGWEGIGLFAAVLQHHIFISVQFISRCTDLSRCDLSAHSKERNLPSLAHSGFDFPVKDGEKAEEEHSALPLQPLSKASDCSSYSKG